VAAAVNAWDWIVAAIVTVAAFVCGVGTGSLLMYRRQRTDEEHQAAVKEWNEAFPDEGHAHELGHGRHRQPSPPRTPEGQPGPELAAAPVDVSLPVDGPAPAPFTLQRAGEDLVVPPAAAAGWPPESTVLVADVTSPKFPMLYGPRLAELRALSPAQRLDVLIMASAYAPDAIDRAIEDVRTLP
jgi:hypothetical protein